MLVVISAFPEDPETVAAEAGAHDRRALAAWLAQAGFVPREIQPLPGDVSPRRYQRLIAADGATAVLAVYPEEVRESCRHFARSSEILAAAGVPVPRVLASDCARGWMLLQDLGPSTLADFKERPWSELAAYFEDAAALAARMARLPHEAVAALANPPLDRALLVRELAQTRQVFLAPRNLLAEAPGEALDRLCAELAADPPIPCHRDFMARNLVPDGAGRVVVLDHQDLRLGPPAYDLASLLNDTLFPPPELEHRLVEAAFPGEQGALRYHRAAAQRTLKAVGTYAAFAERGHPRHLPLIAPTLRRFLAHFARLPEGEEHAAVLERAWSGILAS